MQLLTIRDVISKAECSYLTKSFFNSMLPVATVDTQVDGSLSLYGHPVFETLLTSLTPIFSKHIQVDLIQTYAFVRLYLKGNELKIHRDRPSCEYSFTMHLYSSNPKDKWPIFFKTGKTTMGINLTPGDCAFYKGCELFHWRKPCPVDKYLQVFLHYVDKNGKNKDYAFDKKNKYKDPTY